MATGRIQCPWDWSGDPALRSRADTLHAYVASWAEPYEQEPPRETIDAQGYALMRLTELPRVRELLAEAELEAVRDARRKGASWQMIGRRLHISKQAAQQRYGGR